MEFNEYQRKTAETAIYPCGDNNEGLNYCVIGLAGEVGEIANKWKKIIRDLNQNISNDARVAMLDECGDALYYLTRVVWHLRSDLDCVAQLNIEKLAKRKAEGKLHGSGDTR